jgi:trehalose/maltose hydrolase-like predicted phosphorylase
MKYFHLAAIEWGFKPLNWSGKIEVRSALDGTVTNSGVMRYSALNGKHLQPVETRQVSDDTILLITETRQSKIRMAQAARTRVFSDKRPLYPEHKCIKKKGYIIGL